MATRSRSSSPRDVYWMLRENPMPVSSARVLRNVPTSIGQTPISVLNGLFSRRLSSSKKRRASVAQKYEALSSRQLLPKHIKFVLLHRREFPEILREAAVRNFNINSKLIRLAAKDPSPFVRAEAARHIKAKNWRNTGINDEGARVNHKGVIMMNTILQPFVDDRNWCVQLATLTNLQNTPMQIAVVIDRNFAKHTAETYLAISRNRNLRLREFAISYCSKKSQKIV